jgi:ABC-type Mn2+/Zn2+ transport system ATPase subunit
MAGGERTGREPVIIFDGVSLGYGGATVLGDVSYEIDRGDFLGIIGPNGSGKTTMLRAILGNLKPIDGSVRVSPGLRFGYVIQRQALDPIFPLSIGEVVEMGRYPLLGPRRRLSPRDREAVAHSLDVVGLAEMRDFAYRDLSGGQKQRALLARSLASEPDILLLDEPTNDLDVSGETRIMDLIHDIHHRENITVVIVSHLLHVVLNHVDRLLFIKDGGATLHPMEEVMSSGFLSGLYGVGISVSEVNGKRSIVMG